MAFTDRLHNRGSISTGYDIENSLKFEADNVEYLTNTPTSDGNRQIFTTSLWVKRTELGNGVSGANQTLFGAQPSSGWSNNNTYQWGFTHDDKFGLGLQTYWVIQTNRLFRDTSAWYHIVVRTDTTQSTAADRVKLYFNGVQDTSFSISATITQNADLGINHTTRHQIGSLIQNSWHSKCYLAEINHIDGQSLAPTDFGKFDDDSGIWKPKEYTGTYGTNGFYLDFSDSANLGDDASGNNNTWTLNNITAADQATDTPTNNFCTWMPLWAFPRVAGISEGGTKANADFNASTWRGAKGSMGVSRGKWYWENKASGNDTIHGWQTENCVPDSGENSHNVISTIAFYEGGNYIWLKDSTSGRNDSSVTGTYAGGQVIGFALNLDSSPQTATFYRNGSAIATNVNIDGLADQTLFPITSHYNQTSQANFGGYTSMSNAHTNTDENGYGSFVYAPPSGYYALCTKNLAEYG
jgi:hypothetical protein